MEVIAYATISLDTAKVAWALRVYAPIPLL
jgi:hypothetical protein